ncbi:MAG: hypothetical protein BroJett029_38780 [Alphaproteobacteria bacterium]|nr:MAG: hypothetical protein BroJett029_38780 [Alphaproteobacteria bacterium]
MTLALAIDALLAALLLATLVYGVMLNRRLARLRADRDQLAAVVAEFDAATARATAALDGLRGTADTTGKSLQTVVDRARGAIEDLTFLVERGERAAERLEAATRPSALRSAPQPVGPARPAAGGGSGATPASAPLKPLTAGERPVSSERQALLKALEKMR